MTEDFPRENLNILLNVSRFGGGEAHNNFEEVFTVCFGFGDGEGSEALQISADAILLLHGETDTDKGFKKVDGVHTCHEAFVFAFPIDAADANTVGSALIRGDRLEVGVDRASVLHASELNQTPLGLALFLCPPLRHRVQVPVQLEDGF
jgi:hypothetical protein